MYNTYKDRASFLFVYIHEAHASDEWQMPANEKEGVVFTQPKTLDERQSAARSCCTKLKVSMPCVVDSIDNQVDHQYAGWPERFFIVDSAGKIRYAGQQGPWGFKPEEVDQWLRANLDSPAGGK